MSCILSASIWICRFDEFILWAVGRLDLKHTYYQKLCHKHTHVYNTYAEKTHTRSHPLPYGRNRDRCVWKFSTWRSFAWLYWINLARVQTVPKNNFWKMLVFFLYKLIETYQKRYKNQRKSQPTLNSIEIASVLQNIYKLYSIPCFSVFADTVTIISSSSHEIQPNRTIS